MISKIAGYKLTYRKSTAFLYSNNEKMEFEIKNANTIFISTPPIKYLGVNLMKYVHTYMRKTMKL